MPFYTAITREGTVSAETKARIAEEITRIHTTVMKVPKNFVRRSFSGIRKGLPLPVESRPLRHRSIVYCEVGIQTDLLSLLFQSNASSGR